MALIYPRFTVGPRKAESQMAEEKKAEKIGRENVAESVKRPKGLNNRIGAKRQKRSFSIWPNMPNLNRPNAQMAESRSSGPQFARARFSPLDLDSVNFTV
jgi:hypothetical protein